MHQLHLWLSASPRVKKGIFCYYFGEKFTLTGHKLWDLIRSLWPSFALIQAAVNPEGSCWNQQIQPQSGQWSAGHRGVLALPLRASPTLDLQENCILFPDTTLKCKVAFWFKSKHTKAFFLINCHANLFPFPRQPFPVSDPTSVCPEWKTLASLNGMSQLPQPRRAQPRPPNHSLWVFPSVFWDKRSRFYSNRAKPCWYLILLLLPH